jgi:biofilm PGA synthesis N-glycosyltransferase PgaC
MMGRIEKVRTVWESRLSFINKKQEGQMGLKERITSLRWWFGLRPKFTKVESPKFSTAVVIPAYNEEASIADTVRSVKNQTWSVDEIIVVDDCSCDLTGDICRNIGVNVICTSKNQGTKSRALNCALERINRDLVIVIDADTLLAEDAIEKILPYFKDERTFAVCGFVIPQKIRTIWERGRFIEYLFGITIMKSAQNNTGLVMVSCGCFSAFRLHYLKMLGLFNERTLAEDMDLTWEALFRGYAVYFEQDAFCYPLDPPTLKIYYKQLRRWYSGFLQCMAVHKRNLARHIRFGILYFYYLVEATIYPVAVIIMFMTFITRWKWLLGIICFYSSIVIATVLYKGLRLGMFWTTLVSVPAYFVTRPVNVIALYVSIYQEWIAKKKLAIWEKGH